MAASSGSVLLGAAGAHAQAASDDKAKGATVSEVTVTASRIKTAGFTAPTPTQVLSTQAIQQVAQPNLFNTIAELPALQGSTGVASAGQNGGTSVGNNGLSALDMRGLGSIRTLTLLDGQRVVGAYITGVADVSLFPQLLVQRVDVVTGGASASWGSDAISGVVNFATEKHYEGFKSNVEVGESTYGDAQGALVQAAVGNSFLGGRLHAEVSGEFYNDTGVGAPYPGGDMPAGRPANYRSQSTSYALGAQPAGAPQYLNYPTNAQETIYAPYGLITAGPLQGTAFGANGSPYAFKYGVGCVSNICLGGDDNFRATATTVDPLRRTVGYGRLGFDLLPNVELYATVSLADVVTDDQPIGVPRKPGLTISCTNPFLPSSVAQACAADHITKFQFGTEDWDVPVNELIVSDRQLRRFVVGSDGSFDIAGKSVKFDAYYEHGESYSDVQIHNMSLNARFNAAINPVASSGQIVCSSAAAAEGCLPWNVFGDVQNSRAAWNWIAPANGPYQHTLMMQDAFSASFSLTPFKNWAGDVSVAAGGEMRREYYKTTADPYGNGVSAASPNTGAYPVDPLLNNTSGNNWFAGNYHDGTGQYTVGEAFIELGVPLWNLSQLGKANLDVAGRFTDYSTSGSVYTWKVGGTWDTPLEGVRIRGVRSRDIRAPNLSELFAAPQTANVNVINRATSANVQLVQDLIGNADLKPEIADNTEIGVVYHPSWAPELNVSVDYFDIDVQQAISSLTAQQEEDLCYGGNQAMCANVSFNGVLGTAVQPYVIVKPFNLASIKTNGVDIEASYRFSLERWKLPGSVQLHGIATRTLDFVQDSGIPGQIIQQFAGDNAADTPYWKANLTETWTNGPLSLNVTERVISDGLFNPNYIQCQAPNCPVSTVQHPTINFNQIPGAVYLDLGGSYQWSKSTQFYFKIDNVTNDLIPPFGSSTIYDVVGRMFRIGVRFQR